MAPLSSYHLLSSSSTSSLLSFLPALVSRRPLFSLLLSCSLLSPSSQILMALFAFHPALLLTCLHSSTHFPPSWSRHPAHSESTAHPARRPVGSSRPVRAARLGDPVHCGPREVGSAGARERERGMKWTAASTPTSTPLQARYLFSPPPLGRKGGWVRERERDGQSALCARVSKTPWQQPPLSQEFSVDGGLERAMQCVTRPRVHRPAAATAPTSCWHNTEARDEFMRGVQGEGCVSGVRIVTGLGIDACIYVCV